MAPTRGLTLLRQRFKDFIDEHLPPLIDVARTAWGLEDWQLPYPVETAVYDPFRTDLFPSIALTAQSDTNHMRVDYEEDMSIEYNILYMCSISVVVRTPYNPDTEQWADPIHDETVRLRDDMTKLVQALLKNDPDFKVNGVRLEEPTMNTSYPEAIAPNSKSPVYVAAGVITVNIAQQEFTFNPPIGTADTINVIPDVVQIFEEMP